MRPCPPSERSRSRASHSLAAGLLALCATAWLAPAQATPKRAQTGWYVVKTDRFKLFTNLRRQQALEAARHGHQLETVLTHMFGRAPRSGGTPTQIIVFHDEETFRTHGAAPESETSTGVAGFYSSTPFANFIVVDASPGNDYRQVIQHEQTHLYLNQTRGEVSLWLNEGLAEYMSTARVRGGRIQVGEAMVQHLDRLGRGDWLPLDALLEMSADSEGFDAAQRDGLFHAQSWLLVHYLLHDGAGRAWSPTRLLELEDDSRDKTLPGELGVSSADLGTRLREYAARTSLDAIDLPKVASTDAPRIRLADRVSVLTRLGELAAFVREDSESAEELFRAALELASTRPGPNSGLGYLLELQGLDDQASVHFDTAHGESESDARVSLMRGYALLHRFERTTDRVFIPADDLDPLLSRARVEFRKCVDSEPDLAEAHAGLGVTYLYDSKDPARGVTSLERARELLPYRADLAANLALLHAHAGNFRAGRELMEWVERRSRDQRLVDRTRQLLILADRSAVTDLVRRGRREEAETAVRELIEDATDPRMRSSLEAALGDILRELETGAATGHAD